MEGSRIENDPAAAFASPALGSELVSDPPRWADSKQHYPTLAFTLADSKQHYTCMQVLINVYMHSLRIVAWDACHAIGLLPGG